jgi:hypothetical protein
VTFVFCFAVKSHKLKISGLKNRARLLLLVLSFVRFRRVVMKEILAGVYTFDRLMAGRVYLLEEDLGLTLIDTNIGSAGNKILAQFTVTICGVNR